MDATDQAIVRLLRGDGRLSQEEIGRRVNLSRPAVHDRIRRLEERGVLQGYRALVDWHALGLPITTFLWVRTSAKRIRATGERLMRLGGEGVFVEDCHTVTGQWCLLLKVRAVSTDAVQSLIDRLLDLPEVEDTLTTMALATIGEDGRLGHDHGRGRERDEPTATPRPNPVANGR